MPAVKVLLSTPEVLCPLHHVQEDVITLGSSQSKAHGLLLSEHLAGNELC